jgi:hypothetical protein
MIEPSNTRDELFDEVVQYARDREVPLTTSAIQRKFKLGYFRASRIMEDYESSYPTLQRLKQEQKDAHDTNVVSTKPKESPLLRLKDEADHWMEKAFEQSSKADKLQKFKDYVHDRLDKMEVPVDPESPHKAEGCRIGGRLDYVESKIQRPLINCLAYALRFWEKCPHYRIFYNGDHMINVPSSDGNLKFGHDTWMFMPLESYGYEHIYKGYKDLLDAEEKALLIKYFNTPQQ